MINCFSISCWHFAFSNGISRSLLCILRNTHLLACLLAGFINECDRTHHRIKSHIHKWWNQTKRGMHSIRLTLFQFSVSTFWFHCQFTLCVGFITVSESGPLLYYWYNCSLLLWCVIKFNNITWHDVYHTRNLIYWCQSFYRCIWSSSSVSLTHSISISLPSLSPSLFPPHFKAKSTGVFSKYFIFIFDSKLFLRSCQCQCQINWKYTLCWISAFAIRTALSWMWLYFHFHFSH